ncbi:MAG TPA: hypothetical protein VHP36_05900 [Chitinispirillaceae bacterium]|nr:hypothetical protein [Chitinispirillaceae bacterium]
MYVNIILGYIAKGGYQFMIPLFLLSIIALAVTVNTIFGIDAKEKQKLSVLPGDLLEIYYLDQYALGGRVNLPIKSFIQVGRGIFTFR